MNSSHRSVPKAAPKPHTTVVHGKTLTDDFYWLRNRKDPDVIRYLSDENAYTESVLKTESLLREQLYAEMKSRIKEDDLSVPVRMGPYLYYTKTKKNSQYPIYARKGFGADSKEELLLDLNELAKDGKYLSLGFLKISPDYSYLAYGVDRDGAEEYELHIKNLSTGSHLGDSVHRLGSGFEWSEDGKFYFYILLNESKRPYQVYRRAFNSSDGSTLIYEETDPVFNLGLSKTKDRKFIILEASSSTTTECRVLNAAQPLSKFELLQPRQKGLEYEVDHRGDEFIVRTNLNAVNFRLMRAHDQSRSMKDWKSLLEYDPDVKTESVECFETFAVIEERVKGLSRLRIIPWDNFQTQHFVDFPDCIYSVCIGNNPEFSQTEFRINYTSLVQPHSVYDYNVEMRQLKLLKKQEVVGGYDSSLYVTERMEVESYDGTLVPLSLVYRRGTPKDGRRPFLLYGYGSYGISMDPEFSSNRLTLLDRGVVFAIAHIRGGGDLGRPWYEAGKFLKKKNTFHDFIACAQGVIDQGWTSPEFLAIAGGSAGGLLMGAVVNMRPELFHTVVANVPFVDVLNTMLDKTLPLTTGEYEEWGNPEDPDFFEYIQSYSPYDNVRQQAYPHMYITGGLYDPRVQYWEPAKWVARLRRCNTSDSIILLKTNMDAGHGGASGRYDYLREVAYEYAFLLRCWNLIQSITAQ